MVGFAKKQLGLFGIFFVLVLGLILRLIHLSKGYALWWDSYIYLGMANTISSFGAAGFWEVFRPIVHPMLLSLISFLDFDLLVFGIFFDILFSLASILLVYLIGRKIWSEKVGFFAAFLFAIEPLFVLYTGLVLTEPFAIFLGLLAVYLLVLDSWSQNDSLRLGFVGLIMGLSAMTKFPQGLLILAVGLYFVHKGLVEKKGYLTVAKQLVSVGVGFGAILFGFLIISKIFYGDFLIAFTSGSWIVGTYTWLYHSSFWYYLEAFFVPVSFYLLFFIFGLFMVLFERYRRPEAVLVFVNGLLLLLYFMVAVARKEVRYMTLLLPWFALGTSAAFFWIFDFSWKSFTSKIIWKKVLAVLVAALLFGWVIGEVVLFDTKLSEDLQFEDESLVLANYFLDEKLADVGTVDNVNAVVVLSSHPFVLQQAVKMDPLTADPVIALRALEESLESQNPASFLVFRSCDFLCQEGDESCLQSKELFFEEVSLQGILLFEEVSLIDSSCSLFIYELPELS